MRQYLFRGGSLALCTLILAGCGVSTHHNTSSGGNPRHVHKAVQVHHTPRSSQTTSLNPSFGDSLGITESFTAICFGHPSLANLWQHLIKSISSDVAWPRSL